MCECIYGGWYEYGHVTFLLTDWYVPTVLLAPLLLPRMFLFGPPTNDCKAIDLLFPFNGFFSILIISIGQRDLISTEKKAGGAIYFWPFFWKMSTEYLSHNATYTFIQSFFLFPFFHLAFAYTSMVDGLQCTNFFGRLLLRLQFESKIRQKHKTWNEMKVQKKN